MFRTFSLPLMEKRGGHATAYLSDVGGRVLLRVDLGAEGSSPSAALHHRVHRGGHLLVARVWSGIAGLLLILNLLGLFLQSEHRTESAVQDFDFYLFYNLFFNVKIIFATVLNTSATHKPSQLGIQKKISHEFCLDTKKFKRGHCTHKPFPAAQSTPWGKPWACRAWRCTAGQCSPSAAAECCVSARTAHTPSSSAPPRCSCFQMPWRQPQPCSVTSNFGSAEGNSRGGTSSHHLHSMDPLQERRKTEEPERLTPQARNVQMWEKQSPSDKVCGVRCGEVQVLLNVKSEARSRDGIAHNKPQTNKLYPICELI